MRIDDPALNCGLNLRVSYWTNELVHSSLFSKLASLTHVWKRNDLTYLRCFCRSAPNSMIAPYTIRGRMCNHWEQKGIPICIKIGPRDVEDKQASVAVPYNGKKAVTTVTGGLGAALAGGVEAWGDSTRSVWEGKEVPRMTILLK